MDAPQKPFDYFGDMGRIFLALKSDAMFDLILACTANPDLGLKGEDKEIIGSLCEDYAMVDILENFIGLSENDGKRFSKALRDANTYPTIVVTEEVKAQLIRLREDAIRVGIDTIALSEGAETGEARPDVHVTTQTSWRVEREWAQEPRWRGVGVHDESSAFHSYDAALAWIKSHVTSRPGVYRIQCRRKTVREETYTPVEIAI